MNNIKDIQHMIVNSDELPNTVYVRKKGDLLLLNYRPNVQYDNLWSYFELASRGLIIHNKTGEVVARPFNKFFNWGENGRLTTSRISRVSEKMDGSLGIHYRYNKKVLVATRGSFESEQALWATECINVRHNIKNIPIGWTLLFEIIYPENKVVVDYEGWSGLVLLAIRNRFTNSYMDQKIVSSVAEEFGFRLPNYFQFSNVKDVIKTAITLPANDEGWVVDFEDGQRFKFKGEEYKKLHKVISGFNFKLVLAHHQNNTLDQVKAAIPDEFHKEMDEWVDYINTVIEITTESIEEVYKSAPKTTRKDYAVWVKENAPELSKYMFARLDNRDVLPLIYKAM